MVADTCSTTKRNANDEALLLGQARRTMSAPLLVQDTILKQFVEPVALSEWSCSPQLSGVVSIIKFFICYLNS